MSNLRRGGGSSRSAGRTTGGPEVEENDWSLSAPSRNNMYEAIKQTEARSRRKARPSTSVQEPKKSYIVPKKEVMEFRTEDDLQLNTRGSDAAARASRASLAARRDPIMSKTASARKPAPSVDSMYASASKKNTKRPPVDKAARKRRSSRSGQEPVTSQPVPTKKSSYAPEEEKMEIDDNRSPRALVRPGAERVGGEDDSMMTLTNYSSYSSVPPNLEIGQVDAEIVDPTEVDRQVAERRAQDKKNAPLAGVVEERPWYRGRVFLGSLIVLIVVVIVIAVVVATTSDKDSGSGPNIPTYSPTSSPAPTALALITAVVQLDSKPSETGWTLECDGETLQSAPPGTYALVTGRPNFRIEYEVAATVGAECQLTITDSGGDGLNPGLYEVYSGNNVGDRSALISGGTIFGSENTIDFVVGVFNDTTAISPTSSPTVSAVVNSTVSCTVCPDGSPVLFPEAQAIGALTCEQLEGLAMSVTNETECKNIQDSSTTLCGCRNYCTTMCPDGVSGPDPAKFQSTVFVKNERQVTCAEFQAQITSSRSNSIDECLSANFLGEDVCGCPPTDTFCRICEPIDGNSSTTNPPLEALETEIVPGVSCRDITGIAYTLKKADPSGIFSRLCPACLAIGAYCGCDIPPDGRPFCRLCGGREDLLPEPARLVYSKVLGQTTTCYHVEFMSNVNAESTLACEVYQQDSTLNCCF